MPVILALLVVQIIYASGVIVGRFMLPIVPAAVIVSMGMIVATVAYFATKRISDWKAPRNSEDWVKFSLIVILGGAGNQCLILLGLTRTTAINTAILIAMFRIFTVIFNWLLRRDRPSPI